MIAVSLLLLRRPWRLPLVLLAALIETATKIGARFVCLLYEDPTGRPFYRIDSAKELIWRSPIDIDEAIGGLKLEPEYD
jgi:hypothetical protein